MSTERRILLLMSGSIACAKATGLISAWVKRGDQVRVACTPSVRHFVGNATLEGLSGAPVFDDTFAPGRAMDHIALAQWADLVVLCPATGNTINKLAAGIGDEAVTTLWQAAWGRGLPQFVVPAMNSHMWDYPATRDSVARLRGWGVHVLPTAEGALACGEQGAGRMLEPEQIMADIDALLAFDRSKPLGRILVTGGGTREPIDRVRYIGNHSSGRTSAILAEVLESLGYAVSWLGASTAIQPRGISACREFDSFGQLDEALQSMLAEQRYDAVIHAAAVSDFTLGDGAVAGKLASGGNLLLELRPTPKLLGRIKAYSRHGEPCLVGFKLTVDADEAAVRAAVQRQFDNSPVDYVVHNDFAGIQAGQHRFTVFARHPGGGLQALGEHEHAQALAVGLSGLLKAARAQQEETA